MRFDDRYAQIDVPCLHVSGWYDLEDLLGAFHHDEHMVARSPAAADQYLLYASSDCEDTEWHVKITDVDPSGVSRKVTQGCLRDYPWFARSLNQFGLVATQTEIRVALNTVAYGGRYPSRIILPIERVG